MSEADGKRKKLSEDRYFRAALIAPPVLLGLLALLLIPDVTSRIGYMALAGLATGGIPYLILAIWIQRVTPPGEIRQLRRRWLLSRCCCCHWWWPGAPCWGW